MAIDIVDAGVVIRRFIIEPYTPEVKVLFARMYQGDDLYVPEFCLLEYVNILWKTVGTTFSSCAS